MAEYAHIRALATYFFLPFSSIIAVLAERFSVPLAQIIPCLWPRLQNLFEYATLVIPAYSSVIPPPLEEKYVGLRSNKFENYFVKNQFLFHVPLRVDYVFSFLIFHVYIFLWVY